MQTNVNGIKKVREVDIEGFNQWLEGLIGELSRKVESSVSLGLENKARDKKRGRSWLEVLKVLKIETSQIVILMMALWMESIKRGYHFLEIYQMMGIRWAFLRIKKALMNLFLIMTLITLG